MVIVRHEVACICVVNIAGHQPEGREDGVPPEDDMVLEVEEVRVGDELLKLREGLARA